MPNCPKCGADIDHLDYSAYELVRYEFWAGRKGRYIRHYHADVDGTTIDYDCPACGANLFHSHDDALKFLKGQ